MLQQQGTDSGWESGSNWIYPGAVRVNQNGTVAIQTSTWSVTETTSVSTIWINVWTIGASVPTAISGPTYTIDYINNSGNHASSTWSHAFLSALGEDDSVWGNIDEDTEEYWPNTCRWAPPSYGATVFHLGYAASVYGVDRSGFLIGGDEQRSIAGTLDCYVDYSPVQITANGTMLGWHWADDPPLGEIRESTPFVKIGANLSALPGKLDGIAGPVYPCSVLERIDDDANVYGAYWPDSSYGNAEDSFWTLEPTEYGVRGIAGEYNRIRLRTIDLPQDWSSFDKVRPGRVRVETGTAFNWVDQADHAFLRIPAWLGVDADRDGRISYPVALPDVANDATSEDKPFRFWINDDDDRQHTVDGSDSEEDDLGGGEQIGLRADCLEDRPQSKRDLEDYARLWISTQGLNSAFKDETNPLYLGLQWTDTNGTTPAIKIVKHVETDGGTKYLTDETVAQQQYTAAGAIQGLTNTYPNLTLVDASDTDGRFFVLPKSLFSDLSETAPKTYLLFEGVQVGKGQLRLVILKKDGSTYTKIGDGPGVWMDLKKIEDFYERWTVGDTGGGTPWSAAVRKKTTLAANGNVYSYSDGFAYADDAPEEKKYILYVHGWNMQAWEKNRFAETAFKRLYWQGYKGRFGVFCWPSTYSFEPPLSAILDGTNYDQGEWAAWKSATPLKDLLVSLNGTYAGQVNVMAHSMGNVVTGEALRLASQQGTGQIVRAYVASQAAVPAHCYDGARSEDIAAVFGFWTSIGRFFDGSTQLPNVYPDWLTGSGAVVGWRVNFYNVNDYALWHDVWELNQAFKPDRPDGSAQPWYYSYEDNLGAPPNLHSSFIRFDHYNTDADPVGIEERQLGTQAAVGDRYEIMAFASESRTMAVGAAGPLPSFAALDLTGVWPADNQSVKLHKDTNHPDGLNYSAHKWHSAQFRSTNMRQRGYWRVLLSDLGFDLSITTP
ncbi:MAG: alpha/beta hydrolase [Opitutaceae bacterium]